MIVSCAKCGKTVDRAPTHRMWFCKSCVRESLGEAPRAKPIVITDRPRRVEEEDA